MLDCTGKRVSTSAPLEAFVERFKEREHSCPVSMVEGSFYSTPQALAVAKGRPVGTAYAKEFIESAKASGLVRQAIQRTGLRGLTVAAPASSK